MRLESYRVFLVIFELDITFVLFPVYWDASSYTYVWKCVIFDSVDLLSLDKVSHRFTIGLINSSIEKPRATEYFWPSRYHEIVAFFAKILAFYISLHDRDSPAFMRIILFKNPH